MNKNHDVVYSLVNQIHLCETIEVGGRSHLKFFFYIDFLDLREHSVTHSESWVLALLGTPPL